MTMICVPLMVETHDEAIRDAILSAEHGADMVEFRIDVYFEDQEESTDLLQDRIDRIIELVKASPLPCIVTCRPHWEGGEYHGDDDERVCMFEALGTCEHPPAYIDVEMATYTRSKNIRQKINLAVDHPKQQRSVSTRLILSTHDFQGRPPDLTRKILAMQDEPACSVVKVAYRARSIRDNLEMFELLGQRQKPTIALCMGEFGLMSRVLAPKFGGLLTFASLHDESQTAPGQPTIDELVSLYRFRSINKDTKVYGIIGWPVTQSMSPLVHNAGFETIGWNGVYVLMPVHAINSDPEASDLSFRTTLNQLASSEMLNFVGASVTIPFKEALANLATADGSFYIAQEAGNRFNSQPASLYGAANTYFEDGYIWEQDGNRGWQSEGQFILNTDEVAIRELVPDVVCNLEKPAITILGAGGVARAAAIAALKLGASINICSRTLSRSQILADDLASTREPSWEGSTQVIDPSKLPQANSNLYINCTPVGMADGPDPDGLSIPIPDMTLPPETVFFDTVYNPIETPMLKAAKERGYRTIDGVQMFVKQAEAQFEIWTGKKAPADLFDRLVREKLGSGS